MSAHQYLQAILNNQRMRPEDLATLQRLRGEIEGNLRATYGNVPRFYYGGSYGKDTLIRESFDLDIVMYFPSTDNRALKGIYYGVGQVLQSAGYIVKPQNVALRLPYDGGFHIDVVPGRAHDATFRYATLYKSEEDSTRQTSIKIHIDSVRKSDVRDTIKLVKLWRFRHGFDWSSFALEQTVIGALATSRSKADLGDSFWTVLGHIESKILSVRLVDPANTNNTIDISPAVRQRLRATAAQCRAAANWTEIIR